MGIEANIELSRKILNNAARMNMSKVIILKISQKVDQNIAEYYRQEKLMKK